MDSLILSFEAIAPIFIMMILGYFLKKIHFSDNSIFDAINSLVFKVFLPLLLFYNIYKTDTADVFNANLVLFFLVSVAVIFVLGYIAAMCLSRDNSRRGVMLQDFFRSNYAILGVPLAGYICPEGSGALTSLMVAVVIPVFNTLAVVALERFRPGNNKLNMLKLIKGIITNPLIIGSITGLMFLIFKIKLPDMLEKSVKDLANVSTPLSLIVLGAKFEFTGIKGYEKEIFAIVSARLIIVPLITVPVAMFLGFTGEALACILIIFASPVAVSSAVMVQEIGGDDQLASQMVVWSSVLSMGMIFVLTCCLRAIGAL